MSIIILGIHDKVLKEGFDMIRVVGSVRRLVKRPDIVLAFSLSTFVFCFTEYILVFPVLYGISSISGGNLMDNIMHVIQLIIGLFLNPRYLLYGLAGALFAGLAFGFVSSGCFYMLNNFLAKRKKIQLEFFKGVKKHFIKLSIVSFTLVLLSILFCVFMMVVSVPAVAVTRSFLDGRTDLLVLTVLFDIVTLLVLFFGFMFFRIYMFSWFPAVLNFTDRHFSIGKYAADTYFWNILVRIMLLDVVFILFEYIMIYFNSILPIDGAASILRVVLLLFINWIFKTLFFITLTVMIFTRFLAFKEKVSQE